MQIEDQVITREQAVKLKELGVVQKSIFYFHPDSIRPLIGSALVQKENYKQVMVCNGKTIACSAFTVAELGVMLYFNYELDADDKTEAEGRGRILIDFLEKYPASLREINQRLQNS